MLIVKLCQSIFLTSSNFSLFSFLNLVRFYFRLKQGSVFFCSCFCCCCCWLANTIDSEASERTKANAVTAYKRIDKGEYCDWSWLYNLHTKYMKRGTNNTSKTQSKNIIKMNMKWDVGRFQLSHTWMSQGTKKNYCDETFTCTQKEMDTKPWRTAKNDVVLCNAFIRLYEICNWKFWNLQFVFPTQTHGKTMWQVRKKTTNTEYGFQNHLNI